MTICANLLSCLLIVLALVSVPASAQSNDQDSTLVIVYRVPADSLPPTRYPIFVVLSLGAGGQFFGPASMSVIFYRIRPGIISLGGGGVSRFSKWEQFIEGPVEQVHSYRISFGQECEWNGWSATGSIGASYTLGHFEDEAGREREISTPGVSFDVTSFPRSYRTLSFGWHFTGNINAFAPYAALMVSLRTQIQ